MNLHLSSKPLNENWWGFTESNYQPQPHAAAASSHTRFGASSIRASLFMRKAFACCLCELIDELVLVPLLLLQPGYWTLHSGILPCDKILYKHTPCKFGLAEHARVPSH